MDGIVTGEITGEEKVSLSRWSKLVSFGTALNHIVASAWNIRAGAGNEGNSTDRPGNTP
jgi:hypothetical protein